MAHSHSHGGGHSHDDAYPDDDWNLYSHLERAEGLNATLVGGGEGVKVSWGPEGSTGKALCVCKPHARRLEPGPSLSSDADEQIIVKLQFNVPVSVRKIMVIGAGPSDGHPSSVQCFVGRTAEQLDFSELDGAAPAQVAELAVNAEGEGYFNTVCREPGRPAAPCGHALTPLSHAQVRAPFTNITALALFFPANHGDEEVRACSTSAGARVHALTLDQSLPCR